MCLIIVGKHDRFMYLATNGKKDTLWVLQRKLNVPPSHICVWVCGCVGLYVWGRGVVLGVLYLDISMILNKISIQYHEPQYMSIVSWPESNL